MSLLLKFPQCLNSRRRFVVTLVGFVALVAWGLGGGSVLSALNPTLRRELTLAERPPLDVWIMPPDYLSVPPLIISTPAGLRFEHDTLTLAEGSTVSAHLAEQDGNAPELVIDGKSTVFTSDAHGDYAASLSFTRGSKLQIKRGWSTLASWNIRVIPDKAPVVTLREPLKIDENKAIRLNYSATDDFNVVEVALRVTPHNPLPGADNNPVEISLPVEASNKIEQVDYEDLTSGAWVGQPVTLQLIATNVAGKTGVSEPAELILPERHFFHPVSRVLIEQRKKLMQHPEDGKLREETANIMAGIAQQLGNFHSDPVVMMALRSGAVRLILQHDRTAAISVNNLLWQSATRIEDGGKRPTQKALRDARQDLAGP